MVVRARVIRSVLGLLAFLALIAFPAHARADVCGTPGTTLASAATLTVGACGSGGGNNIDFWQVALTGGDRVQLTVPTAVATEFDLYPPDDSNFAQVRPLDVEVTTPVPGTAQVVTLQAPYSGTFYLAVCQPTDFAANQGDCRGVGTGIKHPYKLPMQAYTFSSMSLGNACTTTPVRAAATMDRAQSLPVGACESGGGNDRDFWSVAVNGGDSLQITVPPAAADVEFDLYAPGTTDAQGSAADSEIAAASQGGQTPQVITLTPQATGTYVLAACEPTSTARGDCRGIATGDGSDFVLPMKAYTFTTAIVPAPTFPDTGSGGCCDFGPYDYGPYGDTSSTTFGKLSVAKQTVSVSKKGAFRVAVKCTISPCSGKLTLTRDVTTGHGKSRKKSTQTLASAKLTSLDTGTTRVTLTLTKTGARLLAHLSGRLRATATLRYDTGTSTKTAHTTITLRATATKS